MSACESLAAEASLGAAPALRAVDCLANEAAANAFGRLFGSGGALLPALTLLLTLYIAFFAISLLTGRSRIGISALTPRMLLLGMVLTVATSWAAYSQLVWNLASGAPDQIAGVLTGVQGSAVQLFADRSDMIFAAIAEVGEATSGQGNPQAANTSAFSPGGLMWLGAVILLLSTVGVLVTARIALAVLLALGPVFVVFALFPGTRGLTAGWLRGVVMTAVTPLFVVLGGSLMLELLVPVVSALRGFEGSDGAGGIDARAAMALFLIAAVHAALMAMVMKVTGTIVSGWNVFGLGGDKGDGADRPASEPQPVPAIPLAIPALLPSATTGARRGGGFAGLPSVFVEAPSGPGSTSALQTQSGRTHITHVGGPAPGLPLLPAQRGRGIGSRFRNRPNHAKAMFK